MSEQLYTLEVEAVFKVAGLHVSSSASYHGVEKEDALWHARGHYRTFLEGMFKGYAAISVTSDDVHLLVGGSYVDVPRHIIDPFEDADGYSAISSNPHEFCQDYLAHVVFLMDFINEGGYRFTVRNSQGVVEFERTTLSKLYNEYVYYYELDAEELLRTLQSGDWRYNAKGLVVRYDKTKDSYIAEYNGKAVFESEYLQLLVDFLMSNYREKMYEEYTPKVRAYSI